MFDSKNRKELLVVPVALDLSASKTPAGWGELATPPPPTAPMKFDCVTLKGRGSQLFIPRFECLDPKIQGLLGEQGEQVYQKLNVQEKLSFLTLSTVLNEMGAPLEKLRVTEIHRDRLFFCKSGNDALKSWLIGQIGEGKFLKSVPSWIFHRGMSDWGGRQNCGELALQVGGGKKGTFVDIDFKNPIFHAAAHLKEMLGNIFGGRKTDPVKVALELCRSGKGQSAYNFSYRFDDPVTIAAD